MGVLELWREQGAGACFSLAFLPTKQKRRERLLEKKSNFCIKKYFKKIKQIKRIFR
jgi:hypothetical protein